MPIYDYLCTACDHRADILHGINDPGPKFCPSCGAEGTMRKQFSAPSIHFKGSGWAKKDRGGSNSTKAAAKSSSGSDSSSSSESPGGGEPSGAGGEPSGGGIEPSSSSTSSGSKD
jgi:putative FmdB family regulatory protein